MASHAVTWRAAARLRRLATVALLAMAVAAVTGHGSLLLLAAPALAALAVTGRHGAPAELDLEAAVAVRRLASPGGRGARWPGARDSARRAEGQVHRCRSQDA